MTTSPQGDPSFDDVTTWAPSGGEQVPTGTVPPVWMQGRASFGGLPVAAALRAVRFLAPDRPVRSFLVQFVGPLGPTPATLATRVLRAGRSMSTVEARVQQDGQEPVVVIASLGGDRPSAIEVAGPTRPERPDPDSLTSFPFLEGVTPSFTRFFEFRWTDGAYPFTGSDEGVLGGWVRHRTAATDPLLAAVGLMDAWPAPILSLAKGPCPASSVTWSVDIADLPADPSGWWWLRSETVEARAGYGSFRGELHAPDGRLAAHYSQRVAVFDG